MVSTPIASVPQRVAEPLMHLREVCAELGDGYRLDAATSGEPDSSVAVLRTPDGGAIELHLDARTLAARATGWPEIRRLGMKRRFGREIAVRLGAQRPPAQLARDLHRRVLLPYAAALHEERQRAQRYRGALQRIGSTLQQSGFREQDVHVVGRNLVLQRPYAAMDAGGAALPSDSTTTITLHDTAPVARLELRNLSPDEACAIQKFVDDLLAQRARQLRLCA